MCGLSERGCHWFREAVQTGWTRLVLDRTPAPAGYALTEITRTSEQPVEEGGQKEEGERKKKDRKSDWTREREGGNERCSLARSLCEAAVDRKRSLTHGDADWATRLLLATLWKAYCTQKAGNIPSLYIFVRHAFSMCSFHNSFNPPVTPASALNQEARPLVHGCNFSNRAGWSEG